MFIILSVVTDRLLYRRRGEVTLSAHRLKEFMATEQQVILRDIDYGGTSRWCDDMETPSALLAICEGHPPSFVRGIPPQRASNSELWYFLCCQPKQAVEQIIHLSVIWNATGIVRRHCCTCYIFGNCRLVILKLPMAILLIRLQTKHPFKIIISWCVLMKYCVVCYILAVRRLIHLLDICWVSGC